MTYEQFLVEYKKLFKSMMSYSPKEAGSSVFAEKMAKLSDEYPEFSERAELEA